LAIGQQRQRVVPHSQMQVKQSEKGKASFLKLKKIKQIILFRVKKPEEL
jgi:hypothetical protein